MMKKFYITVFLVCFSAMNLNALCATLCPGGHAHDDAGAGSAPEATKGPACRHAGVKTDHNENASKAPKAHAACTVGASKTASGADNAASAGNGPIISCNCTAGYSAFAGETSMTIDRPEPPAYLPYLIASVQPHERGNRILGPLATEGPPPEDIV